MTKLFGTDGVRGAANTVLTPDLALLLGKAAGHILASGIPGATVVLGRDTRDSGEMLEAALAAGFCSSGTNAVSAGVVTTPAIATLARREEFVAGAVISASHNPAAENGIKLLGHDGAKLPDETEARIEALVAELRAEPSAASRLASPRVGRYRTDESLVDGYIEAARRAFVAANAGLHLVVDGANGAGSRLNPAVLEDIGFRVTRIHCSPDGANINEACGSTHPDDLCHAVVAGGADLGAAFDGDGDRVILCDEKGRLVDGDRIMALCAANWVNTEELPRNTVVGTVMSNIGLEQFLGSIGVTFLRTPVGDRHVAARMRETGAAIGGEKSGHIVFSRYATTGDGLVTLLRVLTVMSDTGRRLSELGDLVREYPQRLVGVPVSRREGWERDPGVAAAIRDGERRLEGRGRLLVRASGTENLVRVMAEGPDDDEVKAVVDAVTAALRAWAQ